MNAKLVAGLTVALLAFTACQDKTSNRNSTGRPTTGQGSNLPNGTGNGNQVVTGVNHAPTVGVVPPVTASPGQFITGTFDADDPDRSNGDRIATVEFSSVPSVLSRQLISIVDGQTKHNYSIFIPAGTPPQSILGVFTVTDTHGVSTTTQFPITIKDTATSGVPSITKEACNLIKDKIQTSDLIKTFMTLGCTFVP